ncbi:MAG: hypothetical protein GX224_05260 [Thermoplasmatales archaeon]|nr:hypothetical protein [Thermoplasmatales archaeon]
MARQIKDFLGDFGKHFGIEEHDLSPFTKVRILHFRLDAKGNISASLNGRPVFKDRSSEDDIKDGETWVCKVDMSRDSYYFASTIVKLDAQFYFELSRDQMDAIADNVWERHRDMINPLMEDRYRAAIAAKIEKAVRDAELESDERIEELEKTVADFERKDAENRHIIASLQQKLERCEGSPPPAPPSGGLFMPGPVQSTIVIHRSGPDELSSEGFTSHRYFAHFSADQKILLIRPHDEGNIICDVEDRTIRLGGLGKISYFDGPENVFAEYAPQYGGFLMRI